MKYTVPDYYREFHCVADACPATCCAGWQIVIDDKTLKKYRSYRGAFGNRLANSIDWGERTFLQYARRCAFLDERNLCDIYAEAGPDMLCRTCRKYPRHIEEFENERELSLSLSCPVVAQMILERKEKVCFLTFEKAGEKEDDENFDFFLYSALQDCRSVMFEILQNRLEPVGFRMAKVLALAHDVQNRIDSKKIFEIESLLEKYQAPQADVKLKKKMGKYCDAKGRIQRIRALLGLLDQLEVLDPSWPPQIAQYRKYLYGDAKQYGNHEHDAEKYGNYELEAEQLMVYFLYTYFCGAVYDGDAFSKVKMAVVCTLILQELFEAQEKLSKAHNISGWETEQGEDFRTVRRQSWDTYSDRERIAWRFSRELEHSDLNLERMETLMRENPAAEFEELLYLVCSKSELT